MTALVNDLATGRKHLERTGGDQIIPPSFELDRRTLGFVPKNLESPGMPQST